MPYESSFVTFKKRNQSLDSLKHLIECDYPNSDQPLPEVCNTKTFIRAVVHFREGFRKRTDCWEPAARCFRSINGLTAAAKLENSLPF
jgi:hypothetical protein